jgi:hypothetical protein
MEKAIVRFSRVYEIPIKDVLQRLQQDENRDYMNCEIQAEAESIAKDYLYDELPEFINNIDDFLGATVELI